VLETYSEGQHVIIHDKVITVVSVLDGRVKISIQDKNETVMTRKIENKISGEIRFKRHLRGEEN
jgi:sRNA-binding carbon storage regulator CsrA